MSTCVIELGLSFRYYEFIIALMTLPIIIIIIFIIITITIIALQAFLGPWPLFHFLILYTIGKTPWTGDQPVTRPLLKYRTTQRMNAYTDIHASCDIRTHDTSVRASEESSCFRPRGHRNGRCFILRHLKF
jgi:hypothetical protein